MNLDGATQGRQSTRGNMKFPRTYSIQRKEEIRNNQLLAQIARATESDGGKRIAPTEKTKLDPPTQETKEMAVE